MPRLIKVEERSDPLPRQFTATVVARDPSVKRRGAGRNAPILLAKIPIPSTRLEPGPRGPRFHVVDFDTSTGKLNPPALLTGDSPSLPTGWDFQDGGDDVSDETVLTDPAFRAKNVYAIASRTLATFERALGRPVPWSFGSSQLHLVPTAFQEANAYYSDSDQALLFGYFPIAAKQHVYTCLAHDIVAHETTHAILDGLRHRFNSPGLPDQAGFHEGFADVVALLSILSAHESISQILGGTRSRVDAKEVTTDALRESVLTTVGNELGNALHANRGGGLRQSLGIEPFVEWRDPQNREWQEPHRRGEILVACILHAFVEMWTHRLEPLQRAGTLDRARTAEEGAAAARHLLEMSIRAIDYCPPVEFEYEDFLAAMLVCDQEVSPDDPHDYRGALTEIFLRFGIKPAFGPPLVVQEADRPSYRNYSYAALRSDPNEAFRFMWDNIGLVGLATRFYANVDDVRPSVRTGPNGFVVSEWLVDYVQELIVSRAELEALTQKEGSDFRAPSSIPEDATLKIWGGGTLVFDEFGGLKYHQEKRLDDWGRQQRRLEFLVSQGMWDTRGRLGFGVGMPLGQRFAVAHTASDSVSEEW